MKVLILHQHFNTPEQGGSLRSYYLAKALVNNGTKVTLVSGHNEAVYRKINVEGIEVHYLPVAYHNHFGFAARINSYLQFVFKVIKNSHKFKETDICYAISTPLTVGLAAMWFKLKYKIPYIFEVGDLWPEAPIQMGFIKSKFFKWALYKLENKIYDNAKSIVALSSAIKKELDKKAIAKPIHFLPNMADTDFYTLEIKKIKYEQKFKVEGKFVVSYIGALGLANGLDYFLRCASESQKAQLPVYFLICGQGAMKEKLERLALTLALQNITFIDFQNRIGVQEVMNVTDAVFVCYKPISILETGSPNKYFDGLAAGKLILTNFGGWIREEIEENGCGVSLDPKNPADFVKKLIPLIANNSSAIYQTKSRELAVAKYSRKYLEVKFVSIINNSE